MGVVAVACVAVVSAPMLTARGGAHHRGGRPAERHLYMAGVDFTADPAALDEVVAAALSGAFADPGALVLPKGPPTTSDDGIYSPFVAINPPSLGPMRGLLRRLASLEQGPPAEAPMPALATEPQSRGLIQAVGAETPPVPATPPPPEPPVVPDDPPPPVIIVTPVTPVVETVTPRPPVPPPADPPPPAPVVVVQALAVPPAAIPEPGTWAMLLLGFGAIGASIRARRRDRPTAEDRC